MMDLFLIKEPPHLVDLHNHSIFSSDGEKTPLEIYDLALEKGLRIISITDHNNVDFYHSAQCSGLGDDVQILSGIEIDCVYESTNMHLLGYGINVFDAEFALIKENYNQQEKNNGRIKVHNIKNVLPVVLDESSFLARFNNKIISGEDIALEIFKHPENQALDAIKPYLAGGSRSDNPALNFYWDFFSQGKPGFTPLSLPTLQEAINIIINSGGIAVIAHPGQNFKGQESRVDEMLSDYKLISGIEVFNNYHTCEQSAYFIELARRHGKKITLGSDYHGYHKPSISMGMTNYSEFNND